MSKHKTEHVVKLQGKEYVLFQGLLEVAHSEYKLKKIDSELLQIPNENNAYTAIFKATVEADEGTYTAFGDASPKSVNKMIAPHIIRMAETRAIARALRFLTGFGTVFEELGEIEEQTKPETKKLASQKQIGLLKVKALEFADLRNEKVEASYKALGTTESKLQELPVGEASKFIKQLEAWIEKAK